MADISIENIQTNVGQEYLAVACNQTYSYTNNAIFYALVNPNYYDYYYRVLRVNLAWYDGYVTGFHNIQNGIFSTRIGTAIVNGIASQVIGKSLGFKKGDKATDNKALNYITKWAKEVDFNAHLKTCFEYCFAGGTSCLKLNQSWSELWLESVRADYFTYATDFRGRCKDITFFIKNYVNTMSKDGKQTNYFLVEHRCFKTMPTEVEFEAIDPSDGITKKFKTTRMLKHVPIVEYQVHRYTGQIMQNVNGAQINAEKGLAWNDIPSGIRELIKEDYTGIRVNEPLRLAFADSLGVELIRNGRDGSVPQSIFGESLLTNIRAYLEEYECAFAYEFRDLRQGQGQIGVPKALSQGDLNRKSGLTDLGVFGDSKMNYQLFSGNPDTQKPIITQFELRADEWAQVKDNILKKIATTIGMSPKLIASYLNDSQVQQTATQVDSDDTSTFSFIANERDNFIPSINRLLSLVAKFYGYSDLVEIKFSNENNVNQETLLHNVDFKYQNGYIDLREALKEMNPEMDETQLDDAYNRAMARQEELKMSQPSEFNTLGDYGND